MADDLSALDSLADTVVDKDKKRRRVKATSSAKSELGTQVRVALYLCV